MPHQRTCSTAEQRARPVPLFRLSKETISLRFYAVTYKRQAVFTTSSGVPVSEPSGKYVS